LTGFLHEAVETFEADALGTYIALDAARRAGVKRFLCASSINAFGTFYWRVKDRPVNYAKMPLDESFEPVPEDAYSLSKWFNELSCASYTRAHDMTTAAFRFAGVWNDKLYDDKLKEGLKPTTEWSDMLYQWVHVRDLTRGIRQALEASNLPAHGVSTLGAGDTTCPEPTMELLEKFRPDLAATVETPLPGRAPLLSIDRARASFGYDPQLRLGE
jgi:nucleoside-diphosphate-sugar epimerase